METPVGFAGVVPHGKAPAVQVPFVDQQVAAVPVYRVDGVFDRFHERAVLRFGVLQFLLGLLPEPEGLGGFLVFAVERTEREIDKHKGEHARKDNSYDMGLPGCDARVYRLLGQLEEEHDRQHGKEDKKKCRQEGFLRVVTSHGVVRRFFLLDDKIHGYG